MRRRKQLAVGFMSLALSMMIAAPAHAQYYYGNWCNGGTVWRVAGTEGEACLKQVSVVLGASFTFTPAAFDGLGDGFSVRSYWRISQYYPVSGVWAWRLTNSGSVTASRGHGYSNTAGTYTATRKSGATRILLQLQTATVDLDHGGATMSSSGYITKFNKPW